MTDTCTYRVILAPEDIPLEEAEETRMFSFEVCGDPPEDVYAEAERRAVEDGHIDAWAFRRYWEVAQVSRASDTPDDQLRDAIASTPTQLVPAQLMYQTIAVHLRRPEGWAQGHILVPSRLYDKYHNWRHELQQLNPSVGTATDRVLDDAIVRAVATVEPQLHERFDSSPLQAQEEFVRVAIRNERQVVGEVRALRQLP